MTIAITDLNRNEELSSSSMSNVAGGAAADYFLTIDEIPGESLDAKHRDSIEVLSFSWGSL